MDSEASVEYSEQVHSPSRFSSSGRGGDGATKLDVAARVSCHALCEEVVGVLGPSSKGMLPVCIYKDATLLSRPYHLL